MPNIQFGRLSILFYFLPLQKNTIFITVCNVNKSINKNWNKFKRYLYLHIRNWFARCALESGNIVRQLQNLSSKSRYCRWVLTKQDGRRLKKNGIFTMKHDFSVDLLQIWIAFIQYPVVCHTDKIQSL